jgi:hypothetical protein
LIYLSTSKASPNDSGIVIIIIVIIGEVIVVEHRGAIIAQSLMTLEFFPLYFYRHSKKLEHGPCGQVGQMWDINPQAMQSNCKVKQGILLASSFGNIV